MSRNRPFSLCLGSLVLLTACAQQPVSCSPCQGGTQLAITGLGSHRDLLVRLCVEGEPCTRSPLSPAHTDQVVDLPAGLTQAEADGRLLEATVRTPDGVYVASDRLRLDADSGPCACPSLRAELSFLPVPKDLPHPPSAS